MKEEQENSRQATQESAAGRTGTTAEKGGRIQGGVEAGANLEGLLYPERPCMSGLFLMTSSWVGSPTMAPGRLYCLQPKMEKLYTVSKKQDQDLTVAQIMNSLLPNSDLN